MSEKRWKVSGSYAEVCNCDVACPCIFLSAPTEGYCDAAIWWHVKEGDYGGVPLRGLTVVSVIQAPTLMLKGGWKANVYIDEKASATQREALLKIFTGKAGSWLERFQRLISEVRQVKYVPRELEENDGVRAIRIPDTLEARIEVLKGRDKTTPTVIQNSPSGISDKYPHTVAKSTVNKYRDGDTAWDNAERNGFYAPFEYSNY
ncbi:MAG: DUF1326 domain-containing protein [Candidatus Bathyarchaeia archaeon]